MVAVDLQDHGRTADIDGPLHPKTQNELGQLARGQAAKAGEVSQRLPVANAQRSRATPPRAQARIRSLKWLQRYPRRDRTRIDVAARIARLGDRRERAHVGGKRDGGWMGEFVRKSHLAILPGLTHYTIFSHPALAAVASPFLDAD